MKTVTFYSNTRYAGGRSHRNINTLEFVADKDILQAAEHYGYHLYPRQGDDFENGINNENGTKIMDAEDFERLSTTGIGRLDFGETVFYSIELKDIDVDGFKALSIDYQLEYINIWYSNVTEDMLKVATDKYSLADAFEFDENQWHAICESLEVVYIVSWESGRGMRYANGTERGAELIENAIRFESREIAQEYIDNNCGDHCSIEELD